MIDNVQCRVVIFVHMRWGRLRWLSSNEWLGALSGNMWKITFDVAAETQMERIICRVVQLFRRQRGYIKELAENTDSIMDLVARPFNCHFRCF